MRIAFVIGFFNLVMAQMGSWRGRYEAFDESKPRNFVALQLLTGNPDGNSFENKEVELPGYDGFYNNLDQPNLGAIDGHLLRRTPAAYADGTYHPTGADRPNPFDLSDQLLSGEIGTMSKTGKTALLVFFGQQVVEEILDAQRPACPPEYFNIPIPGNHKYAKMHSEMPLLRTRYDQKTGYSPNNPRQQLNEITPFLDGGLMYGITKQWADQLRTYSDGTIDKDGKLAYSHGGLFPEYNTQRLPLANPPPPARHSIFVQQHELDKVERFFKLGNPRGNENTFLLTFGVLWFRWHNFLAQNIRNLQPNWSSDKVFNEARKWVIATQQHIVIDEWLPTWLNNPLPPYKGYNPSINPQIDQLFQTAAFRFGHTLVPPGVYLRDYGRDGCSTTFKNWDKFAVRTCNSFWRPQDALKTKDDKDNLIDIDRLLMGMAYQLCEREDHRIVEDLRGNVFGPLEFPRRDLMAVNVQRGRDHGIPDFNTAREAFGLNKIESFDHFKYAEKDKVDKMKELYKDNVNNIDVWIGGILETDTGPGELFEAIILDQFERIRDGDRFWYENEQNKLFTKEEIARIKELKLYDIIMSVTKLDPKDIQQNVFRAPYELEHIHENCKNLVPNDCKFKDPNGVDLNKQCYHLPQLDEKNLKEDCIQGETRYDYFSNSATSYILTFLGLGLVIVSILGIAYYKFREAELRKFKDNTKIDSEGSSSSNMFVASEWVQKNSYRPIIINVIKNLKQIRILSRKGETLRILDFTNPKKSIMIYTVNNEPYLFVKQQNDYDFVVRFENNFMLSPFHKILVDLLKEANVNFEEGSYTSLKVGLNVAESYSSRKEKIDKFFRVVFAQAFKIDYSKDALLQVDVKSMELTHLELTLFEFADALGMQPETEFVKKMFNLIDKDKNGFISFREFADLLVIFAKGTETDKAKLLFDMYDINAVGYLTRDNFMEMIKSFLETVSGSVQQQDLDKSIATMLDKAGFRNKDRLMFDDFLKLIGPDIQNLNKATLGFKGVNKESTKIDAARHTIENLYETKEDIQARLKANAKTNSSTIDDNIEKSLAKGVKTKRSNIISSTTSYVENNAVYLFWVTLYTLVLIGIFAERAYHYSVESEHGGLRRIAGYGVTITRGAASAQMFTYSTLLVTMSRNTFSTFRELSLGQYLPLDSVIDLHKYIAVCALISTILHIVGHAFNFYHISTQTSDDLTCLFRNYFHATHEIPKFHYWAWQTITGFSGMVLVVLMAMIFTFSLRIIRKRLYTIFWYIHNLYPIFFIFMILHGAGRLIQEPFFHYFFLPCLIIFVIDKLISVRRKKIQIPVIEAKILPSQVTMLKFIKPRSFQYKSGQYVNIACLGLNPGEFHPFTLSSSPDETHLTVHIRAVGPWTERIRKLYEESTTSLPQIYLDGPYGEGHQDWYDHDVSILIGAGIGVTPFASILKDIVFKSKIANNFRCKQVYFIWVAKTQRQFEWMVDILSKVEQNDSEEIVSAHIFITQFYEKFDLRTIFLYICERHYQKISGKSLFTSLKAVTHFGRPEFPSLFRTIQTLHNEVSQIGVFSCGSPPVVSAVEQACFDLNKQTVEGPRFIHIYKSF
nr:dual oxidase-like [Onthophagus taurus]